MTDHPPEIWHEGEVALQASVGAAERLREAGPRVIRNFMTEQHRTFFAGLTFAVIGTIDTGGRPWAGIFARPDQLLRTPDPVTLEIVRDVVLGDPIERGITSGQPIAVLGIDPATRRRNRANGTIRQAGADRITIAVEQSFGNCPQYITRRQVSTPSPHVAQAPLTANAIDDAARAFIARADTFFVATSARRENGHVEADVSHRGGSAGFVAIDKAGVLYIPDFAGNNYFNTLGNVLSNGRAGLAFPDFRTGDLLQITGAAAVHGVDRKRHPDFPCDRFWTVRPEEVVWRAAALAIVEADHPPAP